MNRSLVLMLMTASCAPAGPDGASQEPTEDVSRSLVLLSEVGREQAAEAQFGNVVAAIRSSEGRLYVLDAMARNLVVFDSSGQYVRTMGRTGEGPGEFRWPVALALHEDQPVVWDHQLWRATQFGADGGVLATQAAPPRGESGWTPSVARAGDSWLYLDQEIDAPLDSGAVVQDGSIRAVARMVRWTPGKAWDQVAQFRGMEAAFDAAAGTLSNAPFPAAPLWAPATDTSFWYADNREYRAWQITFNGDTIASVAGWREGPPVSDRDWEAFVGGRRGDFTTPAARERARMRRPERQPVLQHLISSAQGDLWLQLQSQDTAQWGEWHVYSQEGRPRYILRLPRGVSLLSVDGEHVVARVVDSLQVQTVRTYRLDRVRK